MIRRLYLPSREVTTTTDTVARVQVPGGRPHGSRTYDGSTGYHTWNTGSSGNPQLPLTISAWVKPNTQDVNNTVFGLFTSGSDFHFVRLMQHTTGVGAWRFQLNVGGGNKSVTSAGGTVTVGQWFHVAARFQTADPSVEGFLNGVSQGTGGSSATQISAPDEWTVGARTRDTPSVDGFSDAAVGQCAAWNDYLTASEIAELAAGQSADRVRRNDLLLVFDPGREEASVYGYGGLGLTETATFERNGTSESAAAPPIRPRKARVYYLPVPEAAPGVPSAALTGTVTTATESDIVDGGRTIILTLTDDTWVAAGATFNAERQNIIDGLTSAGVEATGWNNEVRDNEVVGAVVRTSDTVVTITLSAAAAYQISAAETVTATVPASALVTSGSALVASPTFEITPTQAAVVLSGTVIGANESAIVEGGRTIILTLSGDTWVSSGATFNAQRQNILDGLTSAGSETTGWNNEVRDKEVVGSVVRTSDTVVTITLSASADYDITSNEIITATVPASAMTLSSAASVAAPTFTVQPVLAFTGGWERRRRRPRRDPFTTESEEQRRERVLRERIERGIIEAPKREVLSVAPSETERLQAELERLEADSATLSDVVALEREIDDARQEALRLQMEQLEAERRRRAVVALLLLA